MRSAAGGIISRNFSPLPARGERSDCEAIRVRGRRSYSEQSKRISGKRRGPLIPTFSPHAGRRSSKRCAPAIPLTRLSSLQCERRLDRVHIFSSRLALPQRIFSLSASDSGTVCIHSMDGGFITNGQSTANRI